MKNILIKNVVIAVGVLIILATIFLFTYESDFGGTTDIEEPLTQMIGALIGSVTIGPICPVESPDMPCIISPEVFTSRGIVVFESNGKIEVTRKSFDSQGKFSTALESGTYVVDIFKQGVDSSAELPKTIEIVAGRTFELNITIDTGIR